MASDIDWVFPVLRQPNRFWNLASSLAVSTVGLFSKIVMEWLNTTTVHNREVLIHAIERRPPGVPLITVSNHYSCFDDPGLWGTLGFRQLWSRDKMRWSLTAHDICFTNVFHSYFFMLGKCVPVVRGDGVYQEAMEFCVEQLGHGGWVHIFPEGRVNMTHESMRLKWGVGRLILDSPHPPLVLPLWHVGMDGVLPNQEPYCLQVGRRVTLNIGQPLDLTEEVLALKAKGVGPEEARLALTNRVQDALEELRLQTEELHLQMEPTATSGKDKDS
ncbi:tafazzin [Ischnura elegans]|uniref:tafazzin n=1 Tax=Ischnura elegans TaxID=197161 RepID=UPI001ED88528|nr:tafazzin [Ischnura elegans]